MRFLLFALLLPFTAISQTKTDTVLLNDIYGEFPVNGLRSMNDKASEIKMFCGVPPIPQTLKSFVIKTNGGGCARGQMQPLYIINDCIVEDLKSLVLNPNDIESINVLKDQSAIKKYGQQGKNGVISITLKNKTVNPITKVTTLTPAPAR